MLKNITLNFILNKMNLLYIEDNIEIQNKMSKVFEIMFSKVFVASRNNEAKEILENNNMDLIISDIKLHDEISLDLINILRQNDINIPVILTTSYLEEKFLLESIRFNVYDYLIKPFNLEDLTKSLNNCIETQIINQKRFYILEEKFLFDSNECVLYEDFKQILLTDYEAKYLKLLFENIDTLITNEMISNFIYDNEYVSSDTIKTIISKLRKIIGKNFIQNYSNIGYRLISKL